MKKILCVFVVLLLWACDNEASKNNSFENAYTTEIYKSIKSSEKSGGTLELKVLKNNPSFAQISIDTFYVNSSGTPFTCELEELCIVKNNVIICTVSEDNYFDPDMNFDAPYCSNNDCILKINKQGNVLEVEYSRFRSSYCGMNGSFDGIYTKVENTNKNN